MKIYKIFTCIFLCSSIVLSACVVPQNMINQKNEEEIRDPAIDVTSDIVTDEDKNLEKIPDDPYLLKTDGVYSIEKISYYSDGQLSSIRYCYYNADDALIKEINTLADGTFMRSFNYEVDSHGNRIKYTLIEREEEFEPNEYVNEYDESGNLVKKSTVEDEGYDYTEYIYDENNLLVKKFEHSLFIQNEREYPGEKRYEYEYDSNGNMVKEYYYDDLKINDIVDVREFEYDSNGYLIKETYYYEGDFYSSDAYENDAKGNKIAVNHYDENNEYKGRGEFIYDDKGRVSCVKTKDKDGNITSMSEHEYY